MNIQKKIILSTLILIGLCGFFPPWMHVYDRPYHAYSKNSAGYGFILMPPKSKDTSLDSSLEIDVKRLLIEWICILISACATWVHFVPNKITDTKQTMTPSVRVYRIVLLEDDTAFADIIEFLLRDWFEEVILLKFQVGDSAWQELSFKNPDFFITDWNHTGTSTSEILLLLAKREKQYPILIVSAFAQNSHIRDYIKSGLNITLLQKPFTSDQFNDQLFSKFGSKTKK